MTGHEESGIYREILAKTGDEEFARWCADRYPWGQFDIGHERQRYEALRRFQPGEQARLSRPWEKLPAGTACVIVGPPRDLPVPMQVVELGDGRRAEVPLLYLEQQPSASSPATGNPNRHRQISPGDRVRVVNPMRSRIPAEATGVWTGQRDGQPGAFRLEIELDEPVDGCRGWMVPLLCLAKVIDGEEEARTQ